MAVPLLTCRASTFLRPDYPPLEWEDINTLHTTDTHEWFLGHQKSRVELQWGFWRACELYLAYEANRESELNQCLRLYTLSLMTA